MSSVTKITTPKHFDDNIEYDMAFVLFYITQDDACEAAVPVIEKLPGLFPLVKFFKVDADQLQEVASKYNITQYPTCCIFKDTKLVKSVTGVTDLEKVRDLIESQL